MTDWRKLLTDEHLWDYRCKAVPVPLVREIVEEVETLRQDLAAARALLLSLRSLVHCENLHHCKADQHSGFGPCPVEVRMKDAIDAFLAGKDAP